MNACSNGAFYLNITNSDHDADRLVEAQTEMAAVTDLHQTTVNGDIVNMEPVSDVLELPPGAMVKLEPGSYYFMII